MNEILDIICDPLLTYAQRRNRLAKAAENTVQVLDFSKDAQDYMNRGIICDLREGQAPYVPRYILPDYSKFMKEGSSFLKLDPPQNLCEAINSLLILYKHVPSITSYPVYLGSIDQLLDPFIRDEEEDFPLIKLFLTHLDRTLTNSFVHANIGPRSSKAGSLILRAERELGNAVPNLTLKYGAETEDDFALEAISTGLAVSKPYFANHAMYSSDYGEDYGIASCYNGLPLGGGAYTLVRLNLLQLAGECTNIPDFMGSTLPCAVKVMAEILDERIRFLVDGSGFFQASFLAHEGLIRKERFSAMFGIFGLAECVNLLSGASCQKDRYGWSDKADALGEQIIRIIQSEVDKHHNVHCQVSQGKFLLHAQSGIGTDNKTSPGCRIPIGDEPGLYEHIRQAGRFHPLFPAGISDIFPFESTATNNPEHVLDVVKGAFSSGMRMFALQTSDSDMIRITGYLVKRSEIEKLRNKQSVLHDTVVFGLESVDNSRILKRRKR